MVVTELIKFAFTGVNIIPTMLLILIQVYWIISSLGFLDLDFLDLDVDVDMDVDLDLDGAEGTLGVLNALAVFINIGQVPFALVFSMIVLNFWILTMLTYYLPVAAGGTIVGILLIPFVIVSIFITKVEVSPLKKLFAEKKSAYDLETKVINQKCTLKCHLENGILGQAEIMQVGASLVINVRTQFSEEVFEKDEAAFVFRKDEEKDVYYIAKLLMNEDFNL